MILRNLMFGLPATLACVVLQVTFAYWSVRYYVRHSVAAPGASGIRPLIAAMLIMMSGTILQVALWAALFVGLGEFDDFYEAVYFSTVNFSSLGYGDVVMTRSWKLLGPLEALCGVLMLGMSAAALMAILQQMIKSHRAALTAPPN
ncbi:MAG TPA: potassium channel family protein [Steroidobacteraceae bacterium]|jgi:hypothetical protein|nr:potassium channel family protein [Steroidobacteraceae bacterium]